jgi:hypothetical protein
MVVDAGFQQDGIWWKDGVTLQGVHSQLSHTHSSPQLSLIPCTQLSILAFDSLFFLLIFFLLLFLLIFFLFLFLTISPLLRLSPLSVISHLIFIFKPLVIVAVLDFSIAIVVIIIIIVLAPNVVTIIECVTTVIVVVIVDLVAHLPLLVHNTIKPAIGKLFLLSLT